MSSVKATDGPHRIRNRLWLASLALALTVAAAGIGGVVWWSTTLAEDQLDDELRTEIIELVQGPLQEGPENASKRQAETAVKSKNGTEKIISKRS